MAKAEQMLQHRVVPDSGGLYDPVNMPLLHHIHQALRAHTHLQARRRLHDQGRSGRHRRRVHRPPDAGPALERRAASGGRSQGKGQDRARESDARDDYLPELLPQVQEALRHDRHRRNRGAGVREDLQPRRHGRADESADGAHRESGPRLPHLAARSSTPSSTTSSNSRRPAARRWSAPSRSRSPNGCRRCCASAASSTSC